MALRYKLRLERRWGLLSNAFQESRLPLCTDTCFARVVQDLMGTYEARQALKGTQEEVVALVEHIRRRHRELAEHGASDSTLGPGSDASIMLYTREIWIAEQHVAEHGHDATHCVLLAMQDVREGRQEPSKALLEASTTPRNALKLFRIVSCAIDVFHNQVVASDAPLTVALVWEIHGRLMQGLLPDHQVGRFREVDVAPCGGSGWGTYAPHERVDEMLQQLASPRAAPYIAASRGLSTR